jgi:hypothetical protein
MKEVDLHTTTDPMVWATEFVRVIRDLNIDVAGDDAVGFVVAWFSNLLSAERDLTAGQRWTPEQIARLAFLAGGAATAPLLADHPSYVFPAERVAARIGDVLREHGIEPNDVPGYNVPESDPGDYLGDVEIAGSSQPLDPS